MDQRFGNLQKANDISNNNKINKKYKKNEAKRAEGMKVKSNFPGGHG